MASQEQRKVKVGMVGGGPGAGIAETHRTAMRLDDRYELVAGVFSRDREKSLAAARQFRIHPERVYSDYPAMAGAEAKREDRIDAVIIVTPTASHYEIVKVFLKAGINVICDKPLCLSLAEARELKSLVDSGQVIFCLTHNYSGYAMVRHAAWMARNDRLGQIRAVQAEHASGWAVKLLKQEAHTQATVRTDPSACGETS